MTRRRAALNRFSFAAGCFLSAAVSVASADALVIRAAKLHTMAGPTIENGALLIQDGKITAVGKAADVRVPEGARVIEAAVATPGLIDAHSTVGLTGIYNHRHDQDQIESSSPIQPHLRAIDAYNAREPLIEWVRSFGVTVVHTGHAPGELISGQTLIAKTRGDTVTDAVIVETAAIAATLGPSSQKSGGKSPGTRGKQIAMLRAELIKAQQHKSKLESAEEDKKPDRDLVMDALVSVLNRELPLLITCDRAQDIAGALRLAEEFNIRIWLDSAAESYLLIDQILASKIPVFVHPLMARAWGERKNMSFETAAKLRRAGIPIAIQSGYEDYVPKTRVVLFEAAIAAANGLSFEEALGAITIDAARILGIAERVGSLEIGKDGDVALYNGDPFEYTTHCIGAVIDGRLVSDLKR